MICHAKPNGSNTVWHQLQLRAAWYGCASSWVVENKLCFSWLYLSFCTHVTVASKYLFGFSIKCPKEEIWYRGWPIVRSVYSNRIFDRVEIYIATQTWCTVVRWSTMCFAPWTNNITYTFFNTCQNQCQNILYYIYISLFEMKSLSYIYIKHTHTYTYNIYIYMIVLSPTSGFSPTTIDTSPLPTQGGFGFPYLRPNETWISWGTQEGSLCLWATCWAPALHFCAWWHLFMEYSGWYPAWSQLFSLPVISNYPSHVLYGIYWDVNLDRVYLNF